MEISQNAHVIISKAYKNTLLEQSNQNQIESKGHIKSSNSQKLIANKDEQSDLFLQFIEQKQNSQQKQHSKQGQRGSQRQKNEQKYEGYNLQSMVTKKQNHRSMPKISLLKTVMIKDKIQINPLFSNSKIFTNFNRSSNPQIKRNFRTRSLKPDSLKKIPTISIGLQKIKTASQQYDMKVQSYQSKDRSPSNEHNRNLYTANKPKARINIMKNVNNYPLPSRNNYLRLSAYCTPDNNRKNGQNMLRCSPMKKLDKYKYIEISLLIQSDIQFINNNRPLELLDYIQKIKKQEIYRKIINANKWSVFQYSNIDTK